MPNRFTPVNAGTSFDGAMNQINKNFAVLDNEAVTKTFKGPNNTNSIIEGRLPNGKYGSLYSQNGESRILIGEDPDGNMNIHVSKAGHDLLGLF